MTWTIHVAKQAEKQLAKVPAKSRRLLLAALAEMQAGRFLWSRFSNWIGLAEPRT